MVEHSSSADDRANLDRNIVAEIRLIQQDIKDRGPTKTNLLTLADSLVKLGDLNKSLEFYARAFKHGQVGPSDLSKLVSAILSSMGNKQFSQQVDVLADDLNDMFSCAMCKWLMQEPVTLICGHSYCKSCLLKVRPKTCKLCSYNLKSVQFSSVSVNILLKETIMKWFPRHLEANSLKARGNSACNSKNYQQALDFYSKAEVLVPDDHLLLSNKAHALNSLEQYSDGLSCAEKVVLLRPDWPKGYYRKGASLYGLKRYSEAATAYLLCLALDPNVTAARDELSKALVEVLQPLSIRETKEVELETVMVASSFYSKHVNKENSTFDIPMNQILENLSRTIASKLERHKMDGRQRSASAPELYFNDDNDSLAATTLSPSKSMYISSRKRERKPSNSKEHMCSSPTHSSPSKQAKPSTSDMSEVSQGHNAETKESKTRVVRHVNSELIDCEDFECALCTRLLWEPVTTSCGHTFCKRCLDRSLDHKTQCPLCQTDLLQYRAMRTGNMTYTVDEMLHVYMPVAYEERQKNHHDEMLQMQMAVSAQTSGAEIPVFVCTLSLPGMPCPLHVFEPRYRLMVRQCMESGTRQFGMCGPRDTVEDFVNWGTMLEIREVQYMPDGRSLIDTVGGRRFTVTSKGSRDGYRTATVEWIIDKQPATEEAKKELADLEVEVYRSASSWYNSLSALLKDRISQQLGALPAESLRLTHSGPVWSWWLLAVMPLEMRAKLALLRSDDPLDRLRLLKRAVQMTCSAAR